MFNGSGSSYTGTVPSNNYKWGTFLVTLNSSLRYVYAISSTNIVATNVYNGSSWIGWQELARIKAGMFAYACQAGQNTITRSSTFVNGSFPPVDVMYCLFNIYNHGTSQNSPNTIESDGSDTIIINAKSAQNIFVFWVYFGG